jgi:hypothetical protein
MNESQLQGLLKLKRREGPGEAYFQAFAGEFHRYQRRCLLNESERQGESRGIMGQWIDLLASFRPLALGGGLAAVAVLMAIGINLRPHSDLAAGVTTPLAYVDGSAIFSDAVDHQAELLQQVELPGETGGANSLFVTGEVHGGYDTTLAF